MDLVKVFSILSGFLPGNYPNVDLVERDGKFILRADVGDVDKDDLKLNVNESNVNIKGFRACDNVENSKIWTLERFCGEFSKDVILPSKVDPENIDAEYKNGVLSIVIPKSSSKSREIKIA